jgi:hypothetical protein
MAEEDESENATTLDPRAVFDGVVLENQQRRDIWWLFHYELADKAEKVFKAAETLRDALGDVSKVNPDEEIPRIRAILEGHTIEHDLKEFQEHFQKMEELLKSVRRMQKSIFRDPVDPLDFLFVPDPQITCCR